MSDFLSTKPFFYIKSNLQVGRENLRLLKDLKIAVKSKTLSVLNAFRKIKRFWAVRIKASDTCSLV